MQDEMNDIQMPYTDPNPDDLVRVVRCGECRFFKMYTNVGYCRHGRWWNPDDYCSYGEKRDGMDS